MLGIYFKAINQQQIFIFILAFNLAKQNRADVVVQKSANYKSIQLLFRINNFRIKNTNINSKSNL